MNIRNVLESFPASLPPMLPSSSDERLAELLKDHNIIFLGEVRDIVKFHQICDMHGFLFKKIDVEDLTQKIFDATNNLEMGVKSREILVKKFIIDRSTSRYIEI